MPTTRRRRFIHLISAWLLGVAFVLTLVSSLEYELFFILSFIGFLAVTEVTAPFNVSPAWRRRLHVLLFVGLLGFGAIVLRRILEIIPPEVLPL